MSDIQANYTFSHDFPARDHREIVETDRHLNAVQAILIGSALGGLMWLAIGLAIRQIW